MTKNSAKSVRFIAVGIANTLIDFGVYTLLITLGVSSIMANYPATTTAMIFSFFANKNYTFKDNRKVKSKQIASFLAVTLIGLWVLQPFVIYLTEDSAQYVARNDILGSIGAKLIATVVSLTWNYILYSRFVFKSDDKEQTD